MIRIVSDGTSVGTKIYGEDNREIHGVTAITWTLQAGSNERAVAMLTFDAMVGVKAEYVE